MKQCKVYCDDCKKEYNPKESKYSIIVGDYDICDSCINKRIVQSLIDYDIGSFICQQCNNTKKVKIKTGYNDSYEMRPEYSTITCPACVNGIQLKKT